jgi:hypothetical protein
MSKFPRPAPVRALLLTLLLAPCGLAQADVIVGDLTTPANYTSSGGIDAFAIGTVSCNIGTVPLNWVSSTNQHPVIGQSMYRLKNGRFEMIGMSWLKHGFTALAQSLCSPCQNPGTGSLLGVGCSDPYSASLNGQQSNLGPRTEVNAATGYYPYPFTSPSYSGTIARRLQVAHADLDPNLNAGAIYFAEGQYITEQDATAGNDDNNASYRRLIITGSGSEYSASFSATYPTVRQKPAILAWKDHDPSVGISYVDVPSDGRIIVGSKLIAVGGGRYRIEVAIQNLNSDRSVQSLTLNFPQAALLTNAGFHDVPYHSNEPFTGATGSYTGADWTISPGTTDIVWATETFASNQRANAIRWGTTYNFWVETDVFPNDFTLGLFKPGVPATMSILPPLPAFEMSFATTPPASAEPGTTPAVDVQISPVAGSVDPSSVTLFAALGNGPFTPIAAQNQGGGLFRAHLPTGQCFDKVRWYVSASNAGATFTATLPAGGAAAANVTEYLPSGGLVTVFFDDMETVQPGWTVSNGPGLTDGAWDPAPAVPVGGGTRGDPPTAYGGAGKCFLTDNVAGNSDVDGDETRLDTPVFSLAGHTRARVRARVWYDRDFGGPNSTDVFTMRVSNNGGASWVTLGTYSLSVDQWVEQSYVLTDFVAPTANMKVRFIAADFDPGDVVEAGVDHVIIEACPSLPALSAAGAGNVGIGAGGPYDVLTINGSAGGVSRRVDVPLGGAASVDLATPPTSALPAHFVLFMTLGAALGTDTVLPFGIGTMTFMPCVLDPANPLLFTLSDSLGLGVCPALFPSTPTPWQLLIPPGVLTSPLTVTLQGVIVDGTASVGFSVTNGVILSVN